MSETRVPGQRLVLTLTGLAVALAVIGHADSGDTDAATVTVNVGDNWFCNPSFSGSVCPTSLKVGDTLTWSWVGSTTHTSTACSNANFNDCGAAQGWDSGFKTSGTFSETFDTTDTFYYRCQVHPSVMRGKIEVVQDSDDDGWSDAAESIIGTDPFQKCGTDAWPPDINNDTFVDIIGDISVVTNHFSQSVPPAPARYDIGPDPPNGFIDIITDISRMTGLFAQSCAP